MTTVLLIRHGRTAANVNGTLAGWTPGVVLDEKGREQAQTLAARLRPVPLTAVVMSPLERARETAEAILEGRDGTPSHIDERIGEAHYGDWTGRDLKTLVKDPIWKVVQAHPSGATFPGGESMRAMQDRAVDAVRDWNAKLGPDALWAAVAHADIIKAIAADALGLHLDQFQRIQVDPCSVTVIHYTELRPFVVRLNDVGGSFEGLLPRKQSKRKRRSSDAVVGGGAGA